MISNILVHALSLATTAFLFSACVESGQVELNKTVVEDNDYRTTYQEFTRNAEIYRDFESKYRITATYLAPKFRAAFSKRLKELFSQEHPSLDEAGQNAGFFISIQSPDDDQIDLNDAHLWTIFMNLNETPQNPILIKRVNQKERWTPFFAAIDKWSREYLIVFESPSVSPNNPEMVEKSSVKLTLANSDAKVGMSW
jgi:hypothetical protein